MTANNTIPTLAGMLDRAAAHRMLWSRRCALLVGPQTATEKARFYGCAGMKTTRTSPACDASLNATAMREKRSPSWFELLTFSVHAPEASMRAVKWASFCHRSNDPSGFCFQFPSVVNATCLRGVQQVLASVI